MLLAILCACPCLCSARGVYVDVQAVEGREKMSNKAAHCLVCPFLSVQGSASACGVACERVTGEDWGQCGDPSI